MMASQLENVHEELKHHQVITDVVPDFTPMIELSISYGNKRLATIGQEFTPAEVANAPNISWHVNDPSKLYTLLMCDPDAPSRADPKYREWAHWAVINIPGSNVSQGETVFDYMGAGPPKGTRLHRYAFLLYEQPGTIHYKGAKIGKGAIEGRPKWSAKNFAASLNLSIPLGAHMFQAQHE